MEYYSKAGLREGYTTGTCAAAAARASACFVMSGEAPEHVTITTPAGKNIELEIINTHDSYFGVIKDAGDDPDATDKMLIKAKVELKKDTSEVTFRAGEGVGTVTLPGLKIPVGEPAINPVPRQMITEAVKAVTGNYGAEVTVAVPGGAEKAKKTFNPRLGITGGLSILGTSGIVRPMDENAIYDSLTLEVSTHVAEKKELLALTFGNTGEIAMRKAFDIKGRCVMQSGNYIGFVLDEMARLGIKKVLLCGHPGKLLKVAAGTFNTHNRYGDGRKEALCTQLAIMGAESKTVKEIYDCRTTEQSIEIVKENGLEEVWNVLADITAKRCTDRSFGDLVAEAAFTDNTGQILGLSRNAEAFAKELQNEE